MAFKNQKIITVERGNTLRQRLSAIFSESEAQISRVPSMDHVLERFESEAFDVLILSSDAFKAGQIDGVELLDVIAANSPMTQVLFVVETKDIQTAMTALKAGSYQYTKLPVSDKERRLLIETAIEKRPCYGPSLLLKREKKEVRFEKLVGQQVESYGLRAALEASRGQYADAAKSLEAGLATLPEAEHRELRRQLAEIRIRQGRRDDARKLLEEIIALIRELSPSYDKDRSLSADIQRIAETVNAGRYCDYAASVLPSLSQ